MSKKATHQGTCQSCGRLQKLPRGRLSKHGYTVDWGFFNGVCGGAGYKPLEEERKHLDSTVLALRKHAEMLESTEPELIRCEVADTYDRRAYKHIPARVQNDYDAFVEMALPHKGKTRLCGWWKFDEEELRKHFEAAQARAKEARNRDARHARTHADHLVRLADEVHGKPLTEIKS
jgi:hypothetical protein